MNQYRGPYVPMKFISACPPRSDENFLRSFFFYNIPITLSYIHNICIFAAFQFFCGLTLFKIVKNVPKTKPCYSICKNTQKYYLPSTMNKSINFKSNHGIYKVRCKIGLFVWCCRCRWR